MPVRVDLTVSGVRVAVLSEEIRRLRPPFAWHGAFCRQVHHAPLISGF
ncbi:MAG TPA: hypothetical protein GX507_05375 [Clostridia bacterium]|nr:hypothetical protein [Clostridia bacterium]